MDVKSIIPTWLAFVAALAIAGEVGDVWSLALAAGGGLVLVWGGFALAARNRTLRPRTAPDRIRLGLLAVGAGLALGAFNVGANALIAASHPALRAAMDARVATLDPLVGLIAAPIVEEVGLRLFLLSGLVAIVARLTRRPATAFTVALIGASVAFALPHLDRPMPSDAMLARYYQAALVAKYTVAALPLGWTFWRWGLPYAMLCHAVANGVAVAVRAF